MHLRNRPKTIDEFIGNQYIKKAISTMKLDAPIMFEGDPGLGKTTLAYILADMFGAPEENITDLNCVHFSKVEDMRDRLDKLYKSSLFGDKRVLILDEIHELSSKTQQVLLKPLENLPSNILVIACTTTTNKLVNTLVERFKRFRVQTLSKMESKELINIISNKENIKLSKLLRMFLIDKSEGIPRRLLIGLDKLRNVTDESEARYLLDLGSLDDATGALDIIKLFINGSNWNYIVSSLNNSLKSNSPESIRVGILNLIATRLTSNYLKGADEGRKLSIMYEFLSSTTYPEKANLIVGLYKSYLMFN